MTNIEEVYKRGYAYALADTQKQYEQGLNDAWECANKIINMSCGELSKIFPNLQGYPFEEYSASETIAKIKEYEESKKLHVGDEIKFEIGGVGLYNAIGVIIRIDDDDDYLHVLSENNDPDYATIRINPHRDTVHVEKTGRYFPQIEEVLNAMKESINE